MARIVYGFGTSHGPLLSTPPEKWDLRAQADRENPAHPFRGGTYTFPELLELRKGEKDFGKEIEIDVRRHRNERNQRALDLLGEKLAQVNPDILVVVGDDQHEWFKQAVQPSFAIFTGEQVINTALDEAKIKTMQPGLAIAMAAYMPPEDHIYPVSQKLAHAIVDQAMQDEFDVAISAEQPSDAKGLIGVGHAVGFIYRRILRDRPVPLVPVLQNTFFPPNQPTPKRCYEFGRSIGRAIQGWNSDARVVICASGGMTHFVIDEELDARLLSALQERDTKTLFATPNNLFRSGTSEIKNWITAAGILAESGLQMRLIDYVPCYRSEAGTGNAMAFATWS